MKDKQNILIYAFKPFGKNNTNISEEVLKRVKVAGVQKEYLQVKFSQKDDPNLLFESTLYGEFNVIIGLGQTSKGKSIRVETIARNIQKRKRGRVEKIDLEGPSEIKLNLPTFTLIPFKLAKTQEPIYATTQCIR